MRSRFLMIMLLMVAAVLSCKEDSVDRGEDQLPTVGFATKLSALSDTRSIIGSPVQLATAGGFNVWGYKHAGAWASALTKTPLFDGTAVTSSDGETWTYGTPINWPEQSNVSFFAYAPVAAATYIGTDSEGVPEIVYTVADTLAAQKDLMIATQRPDQFGPDYTDDPLILTFNHALSQIKFSASLVGTFDETSIKITRIELRNLYNSGTTTLRTPITWTLGSTQADYVLTPATGLLDVELTTSAQDITPSTGGLMLMPQAIDRTLLPVELYVEITLDGVAVHYTVPIFSPAEWRSGKSYKYHISIDDSAIQVIVIDGAITLDSWGGSIALQTVMLTSDTIRDFNNLAAAIFTLDAFNTGNVISYSYPYLGIYAVNDMIHDMKIDIGELELNFRTGQCLLFDFKKTVRVWGYNTEKNKPCEFSVVGYSDEWVLMPSVQNIGVDGYTGATLPVEQVSNVLSAPGSIILKKK